MTNERPTWCHLLLYFTYYVLRGKAMANYPQELAQDAACQSHTGHMTGLWFLPARPLRLNTNEWMNENNTLFRSTCFELIWSCSVPPRKQVQELFMFHCIAGSKMHCGIPNAYNKVHILKTTNYGSLYIQLFLIYYLFNVPPYLTNFKPKFYTIFYIQWF